MKQSTYFYLLRRGVIGGGGGPWAATASAFKTKVEGDGGTLESLTCISNDLKFLMQNP
jgi:hypothetical protein